MKLIAATMHKKIVSQYKSFEEKYSKENFNAS